MVKSGKVQRDSANTNALGFNHKVYGSSNKKAGLNGQLGHDIGLSGANLMRQSTSHHENKEFAHNMMKQKRLEKLH